YRAAGLALRRRVWDPVRKNLTDVRTIFIVPDGTLNLVSFAALPIGQAEYLIEQSPVLHYLSAERDLVAQESPSKRPGGLLAVGGPAYDAEPTRVAAAKPGAVTPKNAAPSTRSMASVPVPCGTLQALQFSPLEETSQEVHDIAKLWTGS